MSRFSFSFAILSLILGLFMGSVLGSLLQQVFGLELLNRPLLDSLVLADNLYVFKRLELRITGGSLLGLALAGWFLYKKL